MEFTLLAAAATGVAAIWATNRLLRHRITIAAPTDSLVGAAAVGLFIGRLASMMTAGVNPLTRPGDILIVRGGVATGFATIGAITALAWIGRHALPATLDQTAPAALAGLAGWHGGCLWRGTCLGTATDVPWAIESAGTAIGRHPVEMYAALGFVAAALVVATLMQRPWIGFGAALASAGIVRLLTEPLRLSIMGGPVRWYIAAIVVGLTIIAFSSRIPRSLPRGE
jgi:prolipoprotein diacylglyceryltransferase